jgi:hypothetical protein
MTWEDEKEFQNSLISSLLSRPLNSTTASSSSLFLNPKLTDRIREFHKHKSIGGGGGDDKEEEEKQLRLELEDKFDEVFETLRSIPSFRNHFLKSIIPSSFFHNIYIMRAVCMYYYYRHHHYHYLFNQFTIKRSFMYNICRI